MRDIFFPTHLRSENDIRGSHERALSVPREDPPPPPVSTDSPFRIVNNCRDFDGGDDFDVDLPLSPSCRLLVNPVVTLMHPLQPGTAIRQLVGVPAAVRPVHFLAQLVALDAATMTLTASDKAVSGLTTTVATADNGAAFWMGRSAGTVAFSSSATLVAHSDNGSTDGGWHFAHDLGTSSGTASVTHTWGNASNSRVTLISLEPAA